MPYDAEALPETEIQLLKQWVAEGAVWAEHWAYIPPKEPGISILTTVEVINPIDNFVQKRL